MKHPVNRMVRGELEIEVRASRNEIAKLKFELEDLKLIVESIDSATIISEMGSVHEIDDAPSISEILHLIRDDS